MEGESQTDEEGADIAIVVSRDVESGQNLRPRNGLMGAFKSVGSYLFAASSSPSLEDEIYDDDMIRKTVEEMIGAVKYSFEVEYMNGEFLDYVSSNLLLKSPIFDWDRVLLEKTVLPSFEVNQEEEDDEGEYCVHPHAPRITAEAEFDVNGFRGSEHSVPLVCGILDGWIFGDTDVWIAELEIADFHCDVPDVSVEVLLSLGGLTDHFPCLCKGDEILGSKNLLKPEDEVLARNVMFGLYVSGKTREDLEKYSKQCGEYEERVLVERTMASTVLLESVRTSLADSRTAKELKAALKTHDGRFYKLAKDTWSKAIETAGKCTPVAPLRDAELKFRRYDGKKWDEVTRAEGAQKIVVKFDIRPVMRFKDDEEQSSVIRRLIE